MTKIAIICFEGVTDIDVFLHWDILNRPNSTFGIPSEQWKIHFLGTEAFHKTHNGLRVDMHATIDEARSYDVVLHASGPATRELMKDKDYLARLSLSRSKQVVASQCSGALVLAASGCFDGLTATTYPSAMKDLKSFDVETVREPFVPHEKVASAAGCLAGIQLDEWIMSHYLDRELVSKCIDSAKPWGDGLERLSHDP